MPVKLHQKLHWKTKVTPKKTHESHDNDFDRNLDPFLFRHGEVVVPRQFSSVDSRAAGLAGRLLAVAAAGGHQSGAHGAADGAQHLHHRQRSPTESTAADHPGEGTGCLCDRGWVEATSQKRGFAGAMKQTQENTHIWIANKYWQHGTFVTIWMPIFSLV